MVKYFSHFSYKKHYRNLLPDQDRTSSKGKVENVTNDSRNLGLKIISQSAPLSRQSSPSPILGHDKVSLKQPDRICGCLCSPEDES